MEEMTLEEIEEAVDQARVGILSLARDDEAYAFPVFYAYEDGVFYWHSHPGEKDSYIHETEEACLTMMRGYGVDDWSSVMAFGEPEPLWDAQEVGDAEDALADVPAPPELGEDEEGEPKRSAKHAVYWRLEPVRMTGRKSKPS